MPIFKDKVEIINKVSTNIARLLLCRSNQTINTSNGPMDPI